MKTKFTTLICFLLFTTANINAQWVRLKQPSIPMVNYITQIDGVLYASSFSGGLYKSTDNGVSWNRFDNILEDYANTVLKSGGYLWVGMANNDIQYSSDNGVNWNSINNYDLYSPGHLDVIGKDTLYVSNSSGLRISYDMGNTSNLIDTEPGFPTGGANMSAKRKDTLWVLTQSGAAFSTNEGTSWTNLGTLTGFDFSGANNIVFNNGSIYIMASGGVYVSSGNALSWKKLTNNLTANSFYDIAFLGNAIYVGNTNGVYKSTNGGTSWSHVFISSPTTNRSVFGEDLLVYNNTLYVATGREGIYKSTSGITWTKTDNGIYSIDIRSMAVTPSDIFAGDMNSSLFGSSNNGINFTLDNTLGGTISEMLYHPASNLLFANSGSSIVALDPSTANYLSTPYPNSSGGFQSQSLASYKDSLFLLAGTQILVYTKKSGSFTLFINLPVTTEQSSTLCVHNNSLIVGYQNSPTVYVTPIKNPVFTKTTLPGSNSSVTTEKIKSNGKSIYLTNYYGVFVSTDDGQSWDNLGFGGYGFGGLEVVGDNIFVSADNTVYYSTDNGANWQDMSDNLLTRVIRCLQYANGYLYAGTASAGVWRYGTSIVTGTESNSVDKGQNNLLTCFPNPATNSIHFSKNITGQQYMIYTTTGELAQIGIVENNQLDVSGLNSGLFFLKVGETTVKINKQ